jgi:predicted transcriptional regulator
MRRLQIHLDEAVDDALEAAAARTGRSKSALIRESIAARYAPSLERDPISTLVGSVDVEPADLDEVVYGRR